MGLFSNRVTRSSVKPGDHIYSWRAGYIYAHHGIYVGDNKVIHFTRHGKEVGTGTALDGVLLSSGSVPSRVPCPTCAPVEKGHGVVSSCLNCFLAGGILYRFEYSVSAARFHAKTRGGTCTRAASDKDDIVIHRAKYLLDNGFGRYNVIKNNCEHFALYCKTGLIVLHGSTVGQSGQAKSFIIGSRLVTSSAVSGMAAAAAFGHFGHLLLIGLPVIVACDCVAYYSTRYAKDVGVRKDVVKVPPEDLNSARLTFM